MCRNENRSERSKTIFNTPQTTSGNPANDVDNRAPDIAGLIADAKLRGTAVTLAAAVRSAGVTTAITYDVRVGTSICDSAERTGSSTSTMVRFGENAARIRQTLEGMCVNTMVLTRPKCLPSRARFGVATGARARSHARALAMPGAH